MLPKLSKQATMSLHSMPALRWWYLDRSSPAYVWNTAAVITPDGWCHTHLLSVWGCYRATISRWRTDLQHMLATQQLRYRFRALANGPVQTVNKVNGPGCSQAEVVHMRHCELLRQSAEMSLHACPVTVVSCWQHQATAAQTTCKDRQILTEMI